MDASKTITGFDENFKPMQTPCLRDTNNSNGNKDLADKIIQKRKKLLHIDNVTTLETKLPEPVESDDIFCIRRKNLLEPSPSVERRSSTNSPTVTSKLQLLLRRKQCIIDETCIENKNNNKVLAQDSLDDMWTESNSIRRSPSLLNMQGYSSDRFPRSETESEGSDDEEPPFHPRGFCEDSKPQIVKNLKDMSPVRRHEMQVSNDDKLKQKNRAKAMKSLHSQETILSNDDGLLPSENFTTFEVDPALEKKANSLFSASASVAEKPPKPPISPSSVKKARSLRGSLGSLFKKSEQNTTKDNKLSSVLLTDSEEVPSDESPHAKKRASVISLASESEMAFRKDSKRKSFWLRKRKETKDVPTSSHSSWKNPSKLGKECLNENARNKQDEKQAQDTGSDYSEDSSGTQTPQKFGSLLSLQSNDSGKMKRRLSLNFKKSKEKKQVDESTSKPSGFKKLKLLMKASKGFKGSLNKNDDIVTDNPKAGSLKDTCSDDESTSVKGTRSKKQEVSDEDSPKNTAHKQNLENDKLEELSHQDLRKKEKSKKSRFNFKSSFKSMKSQNENANNEQAEQSQGEARTSKEVLLDHDNPNKDRKVPERSSNLKKESGKHSSDVRRTKDDSERSLSEYGSNTDNNSVSCADERVDKNDVIVCYANEAQKTSYLKKKDARHYQSLSQSSLKSSESKPENVASKFCEKSVSESSQSVCRQDSFDDGLETLNLSDNAASIHSASFDSKSYSSSSVEDEADVRLTGKEKLHRAVMKLSSLNRLTKKSTKDDSDYSDDNTHKVSRGHSMKSLTGSVIRHHRTGKRLSMVNTWTVDGEGDEVDDLEEDELELVDGSKEKAKKARSRLKKALFKFKVVKMMKADTTQEIREAGESVQDKQEDIKQGSKDHRDSNKNKMEDKKTKVMSFNMSFDEIEDGKEEISELDRSESNDNSTSSGSENKPEETESPKATASTKFKKAMMKLKAVTQFGSTKSLTGKPENQTTSNMPLPMKHSVSSSSASSVEDVSDVAHSIHSDKDRKEQDEVTLPPPQTKFTFKRVVTGIQAANRLKNSAWATPVKRTQSMGDVQHENTESKKSLKKSESKFKLWRKPSKSEVVDDTLVRTLEKDSPDLHSLSNTSLHSESDNKLIRSSSVSMSKKLPPLEKKASMKKRFGLKTKSKKVSRNSESGNVKDEDCRDVKKQQEDSEEARQESDDVTRTHKGNKTATKSQENIHNEGVEVEFKNKDTKKSGFPVILGLVKWKKRAKENTKSTKLTAMTDIKDEMSTRVDVTKDKQAIKTQRKLVKHTGSKKKLNELTEMDKGPVETEPCQQVEEVHVKASTLHALTTMPRAMHMYENDSDDTASCLSVAAGAHTSHKECKQRCDSKNS